MRIDRPVNKDTELHPLVRWQFVGGLAEDDRRAFLFTNVVDAKGKRYDIPVAVGALAASPRIYALGMGRDVEEIGPAWLHAIAHPIPPVRVNAARCQEVVLQGDELRGPDGGLKRLPVPISTPGFDSAPYLTATMCITKDPDTGIRNVGMYRAALKAPDRLAVRMVRGGAGGYFHWLKYRARKEKMPIAIALGCGPVVVFTSPQKLARDEDEISIAGGLAGQAIPMAKAVSIDLEVPALAEIVIEGLIDTSQLEPEAPFGESNGYVALEAFNMPMQVTAITMRKKPVFCSIISQVTPSESCVIKKVAYEPLFLAHLRDHLGMCERQARRHARAVEQSPPRHLRAVRAGHAAQRGVARPQSHLRVPVALRQDRDRRQRRHRPGQHGRRVLVVGLSLEPARGRGSDALWRRRAGRAVRAATPGFGHADRRDLEAADAALGAADAGIYGGRARPVAGAWACRPCRRARRGMATRSATGPSAGPHMRAARRRGNGRKPAARRR